jgi:hypothetical protein
MLLSIINSKNKDKDDDNDQGSDDNTINNNTTKENSIYHSITQKDSKRKDQFLPQRTVQKIIVKEKRSNILNMLENNEIRGRNRPKRISDVITLNRIFYCISYFSFDFKILVL